MSDIPITDPSLEKNSSPLEDSQNGHDGGAIVDKESVVEPAPSPRQVHGLAVCHWYPFIVSTNGKPEILSPVGTRRTIDSFLHPLIRARQHHYRQFDTGTAPTPSAM